MQNISGWININKPGGITSMKAVAIVKSIMQVKKIGHAGTLDPMADGVLPMAINSATKLIDKCTNSLKQYEFTVQMGSTTDTDDAEGTQTQTTEFIPDKQSIINILPQFTGLITQVPPKFSAIKINGQRAYKLARESLVEFEMKARQITIYDIALIDYCQASKNAKFTTTCSKGTYIRSLAKDIMSQVGSLGHINQLSRLKVGNFLIKDALNLLDLQKIDFMVARNLLLNRILRVEQILLDDNIKKIDVNDYEALKVRQGSIITVNCEDLDDVWLSNSNSLVAVGKIQAGNFIIHKTFNL